MIVPITNGGDGVGGIKMDSDGDGVEDIDEEDELVLDYEQDDLSDMEAARHQLRVDKDQKYIPLPRRFSNSRRRRKRNRKHRRR